MKKLKHIKMFEQLSSDGVNKMYTCPIDMTYATDEKGMSLYIDVEKMLKPYNLSIIGLKPIGPAGGNLQITVKGTYSDIARMVSKEMPHADLEGIMQSAVPALY